MWLIGVDAGGSKTVAWAIHGATPNAILAPPVVNVWGIGHAGPANVRTHGVELASRAILAAIQQAVAAALARVAGPALAAARSVDELFSNSDSFEISDEVSHRIPAVLASAQIHVGAAGAADPAWATALRARLLPDLCGGALMVGSDLDLVLAAVRSSPCDSSGHRTWDDRPTLEAVKGLFHPRSPLLDEGHWVAVIAGTGSVVCDRQRRIGGWGPLVGDAGSGFAVGRRALAAACAAEDGSGPCTLLRERLLADTGVASIREWLGHLPTWPAAIVPIADLARHVTAVAATDGVAAEILATEMGLLAEQIVAARRDGSAAAGPVSLALAGGLLTGHTAAVTVLLACVDQRLEQVGLPPFVRRARVCRPVFGALQLACAAAITG